MFDSILGNGKNRITINGETFDVSGNSISIKNGKVTVDGKVVKEGLSGDVHDKFEGDLAKLDCNTCTITGNVHEKVNANTVHCRDVGGDIDANTVHCGNVAGDIDANSVRCQNSSGKIKM